MDGWRRCLSVSRVHALPRQIPNLTYPPTRLPAYLCTWRSYIGCTPFVRAEVFVLRETNPRLDRGLGLLRAYGSCKAAMPYARTTSILRYHALGLG